MQYNFSSSLIHNILVEAHDAGKQFRVIVVDGRPWLEGKEQLRRLAKHGIECSYILINALSFIMPEVYKYAQLKNLLNFIYIFHIYYIYYKIIQIS